MSIAAAILLGTAATVSAAGGQADAAGARFAVASASVSIVAAERIAFADPEGGDAQILRQTARSGETILIQFN